MPQETDAHYFARRQEQEVLLAVSAITDGGCRTHLALANAYRAKFDALKKAAAQVPVVPTVGDSK